MEVSPLGPADFIFDGDDWGLENLFKEQVHIYTKQSPPVENRSTEPKTSTDVPCSQAGTVQDDALSQNDTDGTKSSVDSQLEEQDSSPEGTDSPRRSHRGRAIKTPSYLKGVYLRLNISDDLYIDVNNVYIQGMTDSCKVYLQGESTMKNSAELSSFHCCWCIFHRKPFCSSGESCSPRDLLMRIC